MHQRSRPHAGRCLVPRKWFFWTAQSFRFRTDADQIPNGFRDHFGHSKHFSLIFEYFPFNNFPFASKLVSTNFFRCLHLLRRPIFARRANVSPSLTRLPDRRYLVLFIFHLPGPRTAELGFSGSLSGFSPGFFLGMLFGKFHIQTASIGSLT